MFEPSTTSPIGRRAKRLEMGVISSIGDGDIVCSAWKHAAGYNSGYGFANHTEHQDFSTVVSTKRVSLIELDKYKSDLLEVTDEDRDLGFKHVFQTRQTKATVGERIRSPMGMFTKEQTYMDNDCQRLLDHLALFYGN